jgi:hypothetical protein
MAFTRDQLVAMYGSDYPDAVDLGGVRMPLTREGKFLRTYNNKEAKQGAVVSRFMDGTAEISLSELMKSWPHWTRPERYDFTSAACWLHEHPEFPDMIRFVLEEGDQDDISAVALQAASALPSDEAFQRLSAILQRTPVGNAANINQAIAHTKHADAPSLLRERLRTTLEDSRLMAPDKFLNWVAYDAICCIDHLLDIGFTDNDFEDDVRRLSKHPSEGTIDSLRRRLAKWYPWLGDAESPETKP